MSWHTSRAFAYTSTMKRYSPWALFESYEVCKHSGVDDPHDTNRELYKVRLRPSSTMQHSTKHEH
eukprot:12391-Eustigmatos_ZCMA.PRE.1